jgi:hypothetical protein
MGAPYATLRYRRLWLLGVVCALVAALLAADTSARSRLAAGPCGANGYLLGAGPLGGPALCAHLDQPPPGVDVHAHVSTAALLARRGAGASAYAAAEADGVASALSSATVTSPSVPCGGDGTSGYRVQPMYVVEAGRPNRFSALRSSFQLWAAGVDDVINRSAALTGGVRDIRYVTAPASSGTGCVAHVLNVTVPAGSLTSFDATINALAALGYKDKTRKYLIWADATALCGIATLYPYNSAAQTNPNNGGYPQYARIDSGCWGSGDGSYHGSVEAHELTHTLGSVLSGAPHATPAGHCWDDADTMCYADGGPHPMVQVCPAYREYLLDCNSDDYFSTSPPSGSWLSGHWNVADSRFLIGGGDGTSGGLLGTIVSLGAQLLVNNPAVPGLATQLQVNPLLPPGDSVASIRWRSARSDCTFSNPRARTTQVTCGATATGSTTVTVTVTDSAGAVKTTSAPLTFATAKRRAVAVVAGLRGQHRSTQIACRAAPTLLTSRVIDLATGAPIKGLLVRYWARSGTTSPRQVAAQHTNAAGAAGGRYPARVGTLTGVSMATDAFKTASAAPVTVRTHRCTLDLSGSTDRSRSTSGAPVVVTGTVHRLSGLPVFHAPVSIIEVLASGSRIRLRTVRSGADGGYRVTVRPTVGGVLRAVVAARTSWSAVQTRVGALTLS